MVVSLLVNACGQTTSPTGPSNSWVRTLPSWSPYVVIQPNHDALPGYEHALTELVNQHAVLGARIPLYGDGRSQSTVHLAASLGLDVVGIIANEDLLNPNSEKVFDQYAALYPEVRTFQVGNEITASLPRSSIGIEEYMDVLGRIYAHVATHYPAVTLVSQSTVGSGEFGAHELATMSLYLKMMGLSPRRLIVGINVYSLTASTIYANVIGKDLIGYRVWIMESGVADQSQQIAYVNRTYPRLRTLLGAERIYWYALWAGDVGGDSEFSLIKNPTRPPIVAGPLFRMLADVE